MSGGAQKKKKITKTLKKKIDQQTAMSHGNEPEFYNVFVLINV